jgi:Tol biopolymer transport system component/Zn-dependent protease with chaperone function
MEGAMTYSQLFFGWLLQTTLIASLVICLILLIQRLLGDKLGPRWSYALWLVLLIRMVLPWSPSSRVSLSNLIASWQRQTQSKQSSGTVEVQKVSPPEKADESLEAIASQEQESELVTEQQVKPKPRIIIEAKAQSGPRLVLLHRILPILWLAGAIVIGVYLLVSDLMLWRIVKRDRPLLNQSMLELFEECKAQMGVQSLVVVVPSDRVRSPGLFGFVRPRLLLPRQMLDNATAEEMRYVFLHELAHLRRHDIYLGWLASLLQVLHWFNPLVWFAFYRMRADRELACDALVLTRTGQDKSQEYGGAIVELVRRFSRSRPLPAMAGIIESKSQLKRRIAMITKFKNKSYRWSPLAVVMIVILASICLPNAMRTKASEAAASQPVNRSKFTKIHIPNRINWDAQMSPDGKSILFVNDERLWVAPRSSKLGPSYLGAAKPLDTADVCADWCGFTWSADGRWIAFNGKEVKKGYQRIYVVSADGGESRLVHENNRDVRVVNYRMSLSPHGETLAFTSVDANELHIYTIPVNGGRPRKLVDARAREPVFSPDGKMIAYVEDKALGRAGGGLWVVPAAGGTPTLVAGAGNASTPVWSPDGTMLAFVDYAAPKEIHIISVTPQGNPDGKKISLSCPEGFDEVRRLTGWTPDNEIGALFGAKTEFALYAQPVQGGKAMFVTYGGYPTQPHWSPDGKRIVHVNLADKTSGDWWHRDGSAQCNAISFVSAEGGDVSAVSLQSETKIRIWPYGAGSRISPDGKMIVFAGQKPQEMHAMHIWTLPVAGGTPTQLTDAPSEFRDWYPCWSPDGRHIAFVRSTAPEHWGVVGKANIYVVSVEGGEPRQITSEADRVFDTGPVVWSPDGMLLAYFSRDKDDAAVGTIKVISPEGGEPKIVTRVEKIFANKEMAWSADSKRIAYNAPDNKIKIVSLDDETIEEIMPDLKDVDIYHLDWSPDGKTFALCGYTGGGPEFWMMENFLPEAPVSKLAHQTNFRKILIPTKPGNGVISPDGKKLAFVSQRSVWVAPVHGKVSTGIAGEPVKLAGTEGAWNWGMRWSADGKWIAYNTLPSEDHAGICIVPSSGGEVKRIVNRYRAGVSLHNYLLSLSPDGKIVAFTSQEKGKNQLFTVTVERPDVKQLTEDGGAQPAFSPDGKKIAYVKEKPQQTENRKSDVWVIPAAGGTPVQVSDLPMRATGPIWSPDGKLIAFTRKSTLIDMSKDICIVPVSETGKPETSHTQIKLPLATWDFLAGWTQDNKIGVLLTNPDHYAIYTVPASGGNATQVTAQGYYYSPRWSPDGKRLYLRAPDGPDGIASVSSEGGEISIKFIDANSMIGGPLQWGGNVVSPDGQQIVFCASKKDNKPFPPSYIYTIPVEGGEPKQLTVSPDRGRDRFPCWSPDGKSIAFIRYSSASWDKKKHDYINNICIVRPEGGEVRQLTSESDKVARATIAWSPDGKSIAYYSKDKTIRVIPVKGEESREVVEVDKVNEWWDELTWSGDGKNIAYSSKGSIWVVSLDGGKPEEIKTGLVAKATHLSWSPDGKKIAFTASEGGDTELWMMENFLPEQMGK